MEKVQYIIVGDGFAGLFFANQLLRNGHSFRLFADGKRSASKVSAGIANPLVLKKFTTFWKAQQQLDCLRSTLKEIQQYTGENFLIEEPVRRIFHDEKERELWLKKANDLNLAPFMSKEFRNLPVIDNPYGTGEVLQSARLNVPGFFSGMERYLDSTHHLIRKRFDHNALNPEAQIYGGEYQYENIVFAEGIAANNNPFFADLPVQANKGHHLQVKLLDGSLGNETIKKKHFLFPISGTDLHYYGGTYDRFSVSDDVDDSAITQLQAGLAGLYRGEFQIENVSYGFRPTVADRRPILGRHYQHQNMFIFNGLGARGILNGCYFAEVLYDFIAKGIPLPDEVNLERWNVI